MSVLIKGKALPKCCGDCWLARCVAYSDYCRVLSVDINVIDPTYKHPNCPLVEVPEPHGDLIDRDAFRADYGMGENCDKCENDSRSCEYDFIYSKMDFCGWIDDAPIVIEGSDDHADD